MNPGAPLKRTELTRKTPLAPGKPLQRGTSSLRCSGLFRRSPVPAVSSKRRSENRERTKLLAPLRAEQTWCSRCGVTGVGLDAHELLSAGRGGSRVNLANIVLLCRPCHDDVTFRHDLIPDADRWILSRGAA